MSEPERPCRRFSCDKMAVPGEDFCYLHKPYKIPCGRVLGHGESCVEDYMCGGCEEIKHLREVIGGLNDVIRAISTLLDNALTKIRDG